MKILNHPKAEGYFLVIVFSGTFWVRFFELSIGFYSMELLILYSLFVAYFTEVIYRHDKYSFKEAMAISFLVVYLNSWYWEGLLHLWTISANGINLNQIYQLAHLIPAVYFLIRWEFYVNGSIDALMKGWLASGVITFLRLTRFWIGWGITGNMAVTFNHGLMNLNRIVCLFYLYFAIVRFGFPKKLIE